MLKITRPTLLTSMLALGTIVWGLHSTTLAQTPAQILPAVANFQPVNNSLPKADPRRYSPPAAMYQNHARDYSRMLYYYGNSQAGLKPTQAQQYVGEIKKNLDLCNKELQNLQAANPNDARVKESVSKIEQRHAKVVDHCNVIAAESAKGKADTITICDCCVDIDSELKAAQPETDALLKHLKLDNVPVMKKSTEKPVAK